MPWVFDFETTTDPADCRVWAWAVCNIENPDETHVGIDISTFLEFCERNPDEYWAHNLAFDGEFILSHILTHGWEYSNKLRDRTFSTLISNQRKFYQMKLCFKREKRKGSICATFKDSLKKLPMSVDKIARGFNLPLSKLEIDYSEYRAPGHKLTKDEYDYIINDVRIVALALREQFGLGLDRLTIGSDALNGYKDLQENFKQLFPVLPQKMDEKIRLAYRGGWTYANPRYQADESHPSRTVKAGSVYDVNSLYPSVMYDKVLPHGYPVRFDGEYQTDKLRPLYIQFLTCSCELKPGYLPTLQIKGNPYFKPHEYVTNTGGMVELALTNVDLDLLFEHYNVEVMCYNGGFKFSPCKGVFCGYIDYWSEVKANNKGAKRQLAKLMLNSLYGKFATNPDVTPMVPYLKDDGSVGYRLGVGETREPVYTAMACFITAYARETTIRAAQANYDRFLYADTDSIHLLGCQVPDLDVHPTRLGAWKEEAEFSRAKYVRAKTYIEKVTAVGGADANGEMRMLSCEHYNDVKCAGMPEEVKKNVTFSNFKRGSSWGGKLRPRHVPGGIVLEETTFTLT